MAADFPFLGSPDAYRNIGLAAQRGKNGHPQALGVLSLVALPRGGATGARAFLDQDPDNDFYGQKLLSSGQIIQGELSMPVAGAGGDAINGNVWPPPIFDPTADEKGAAGAGGGGLGIIEARFITLGARGLVVCNGGQGGPGESTIGSNTVGGSSGGGSGGYLLMQAQRIDLRQAREHALSAIGGHGGWGNYYGLNAGGNGGPGVIALHVSDPATNLLLPAGQTVENVTSPPAHVLLPVVLP